MDQEQDEIKEQEEVKEQEQPKELEEEFTNDIDNVIGMLIDDET